MLRGPLIAAAVALLAGIVGAPADAARPGGWVHTATTPHFAVHYTSDPQNPAYTTQGEATALAALAERAYAAETGWGFHPPLDDGDGKVDVFIQDLSAFDVLAYAAADTATPTATGYVVFGVGDLGAADEGETIAHELFHVIQYGTWALHPASDSWLFEGSAEWAAASVAGFPADFAKASGPGSLSLDCSDSIVGFQECDVSPYLDGGYSRWPFFQSLAARFGGSFLESVLAQGAAGMSATAALSTAIGARGASLADVYNDWAVQQMAGGYGVATLDALRPAAARTVSTGVSTGKLPSLKVPVDHLATQYVEFTRGDGSAAHACYAATLTVTATIPSGVTSRPFLFWDQTGSRPVALAVSGSTASATIPWDTCLWSANGAYLALPNDTTDVDAADFVVDASIAVDLNTPASATAPPAQDTIYGGTTPVSSAETAPTISLFGPLLLTVPAAAPVLRLIVESSDAGKLHGTLGGIDLGTRSLRAGNNDVRFTIPPSLLSALRRSSTARASVLSLTPLSSSGANAGKPVTRQVAVTRAIPKRTKHKK
jgi:hypothetical protein